MHKHVYLYTASVCIQYPCLCSLCTYASKGKGSRRKSFCKSAVTPPWGKGHGGIAVGACSPKAEA